MQHNHNESHLYLDADTFPFSFEEMRKIFNDDTILSYILPEINREDRFYSTILSIAVSCDDIAFCKKLLRNGANPDMPSSEDSLVCAINSKKENSFSIFKEMLPFSKKGAFYVPRINGGSLLLEAVRKERLDIAAFLLKSGSSLNEMNIDCNFVWAHAIDVGGEPYLTKLEALLPENCFWERPVNLDIKMKGPIYS